MIGNAVNVGSPTSIGPAAPIGVPTSVGGSVPIAAPSTIGSPGNIGIAEQSSRPIEIGRPNNIGLPVAVGNSAAIGTASSVANVVTIGVVKEIANTIGIGVGAPVGNSVSIGNPYLANRALDNGTTIPIGAPTSVGTPTLNPTNPYSQILAKPVDIQLQKNNTNIQKSTASSAVSINQQALSLKSDGASYVKLSDIPRTGVDSEPNNINGGIQVQSDPKNPNPFVRDWTQNASATTNAANSARGDITANVGSSGIANTTPAFVSSTKPFGTRSDSASRSNTSVALSISQPSSTKLTPAQNFALLPSYQQAEKQTPSCIVFVRAKLAQEGNGNAKLPIVDNAADLLTLAKSGHLPGFTYTPLAAALQSHEIKPGDVLIWQANVASDGSGHVAYVSSVDGSKVIVEQRNFSTPDTRAKFASTSPGYWLDTETIDLTRPNKIAGVISIQ